jgi:anti-sigma B factor antagonist
MDKTDEIQIEEGGSRGRVSVLRVAGRLDADTAPILLERCGAIQAQGRNLVLNLSGVTFLGSSGIGAMLALVEQFQEQAGAVHFVAPSATVRDVVELLDLGGYLPIDDSEEAALAALAA